METLVKALFLIIPLALLTVGIVLIVQVGTFSLDIVGHPKVEPVVVAFDQPSPVTATIFAPAVFRPDQSPISTEVEIQRVDGLTTTLTVTVSVVEDCDYIRIVNGFTALPFNDKSPVIQSANSQVEFREMIPAVNCELTWSINDQQATGMLKRSIPINAWTGHLLAVGKLIIGILGTLAGLIGLKELSG